MKLIKSLQFLAFASATVLALGLSTGANAVDADAAQALAKKNTCLRCHAVDKEKEGPTFKAIAAKYKGQADAVAKLTKHLTSGEKAKFSDGHEEPHKIIEADDPAEITNLVDWILSK